MRNKLFGRLMSVALSATVALTSGVPALAYDGGGDLLEDDDEIQLLDEEDVGSDFDAPEFEEEELAIEDEAEFLGDGPFTITLNYKLGDSALVPYQTDADPPENMTWTTDTDGKLASMTEIPNQEFPGYHLLYADKWFYSDGESEVEVSSGESGTTFTQNSDVYAKFSPNTYKLGYTAKFYDGNALVTQDVPAQPTFAAETFPETVTYSSSFGISSSVPTVSGYTFDGWYTTLNPETSVLSGVANAAFLAEIIDGTQITPVYAKYNKNVAPAIGANPTYVIQPDGYYTGTDGTSAGGDGSAKDADTAEFVYGTVYTKGQSGSEGNTNSKYVFTARDFDDNNGTGDVDSDVTWSIWKFKAIKDNNDAQLSDAALLADDNLEDASSDFASYGLYAQAKTNGTFEIGVVSGKYAKKALNASEINDTSAFPGANYVLKVADKSSSTRKAKLLPITVKVDEAAIKIDNTALNTFTIDSFPAAKMGYEVLDADANVEGKTAGTYVKAKEFTLSVADILPSYSISDIDFELSGDDADMFDVGLVGEGAMAGDLFTNNNVKFKVVPISDLTSIDSYDEDGTYEAVLSIKTDALYEPAEYAISFTVENNIKFSKVIAHGGKEVKETIAQVTPAQGTTLDGIYYTDSACENPATGTANGSSQYYIGGYNLGTIKKGENFDDIYVYVTGGNYAILFTQTGEGFENTGIKGTPNEASSLAFYNVHGMAKGTVKLGTHSFILEGADGDTTSGDTTGEAIFFYTVEEYDAAITIDSEDPNGAYDWFVPSDYTENTAKKEIVIKNNSNTMLSLTVTKANAGDGVANAHTNFAIDSEEYTEATKTITVAAGGGESKVTITPKASLTAGVYKANLTIADGNSYSEVIALTFEVKGGDANITKPAADGTITPAGSEWEVGKSVEYQLELTKVTGVDSVEWSIDATTADPDPESYTDDADDLKAFGLTLSKDGKISGVPKKVGTLNFRVKATYKKNGTAGAPQYRKIAISTVLAEDGFKFTSGGKDIDDDKKALDYGEIKADRLDTFAVDVNVTNTLELDMISDPTDTTNHYGNVKLEILNVDGGTDESDIAMFAIVLDAENEALNSDLLGNGFDLQASESQTFTLKTTKDAAFTVADDHYVTVQAWHRNAANASASESAAATYTKAGTFKVVFDVKDAPVIDPAKVDGFVSGKQVKSADDKKYTIETGTTYAGSAFTYAWTAGEVPGLELAEDGTITGTPEKAGKYTVTVTATKSNDAKVTGVLTHDIIVDGAAELVVNTNLKVGASDAETQIEATDKINILLPGMVVGDTVGEKQVFTIAAATGAGKKDAENVTITVTDAEDNRTDAAAIRKSPANPYAGSSNYIGVDTESWTKLEKGTIQKFRIVSKGQPTAGIYKVKIIVSADNANEIAFYAIMVVTDKLVITQPDDVNTNIGKKYYTVADPQTTYKDTSKTSKNIIISATGGAADQKIKWSEVGTKVTEGTTEKTKFYVTKGTKGEANDGMAYLSDDTGLGLAVEGDVIGATPSDSNTGGLKNEIFGQIKAAGTYTVNLSAKVEAIAYGDALSSDPIKKVIDLSTANSWTIEAAAATKMVPEQTADTVTFDIVSAKTENVVITKVADTAADTEATRGKVEGLRNGNLMVTRTGYTYYPVASYDNNIYTAKVTIENKSGIALGKMKAEFSTKNFEIASGGSATAIAVNGTQDITFRPAANLDKGEYTDTLTISGDDFESLTFAVKFTVEDATYLASVYEPDPDDSTKNIVYVDDNVVGDKVIELASFVAGKTATGKDLTIENTGNTTLSRISVYEVDAEGNKYDDGADTMLTFTSPGTSLTPNSEPTGFTVTPKKTVAGKYNSYINIHFTEGTAVTAEKKDIIIPVTYTVYSNDVSEFSVTPAEKTTIAVDEGYDKTEVAVTFTIANTSSNDTDVISKMKLASFDEDFEVVDNTAVDIKPGESAEFTIRLKSGKSAGKYTTDVVFGDGSTNIKTKAKRTIEVTVSESTAYTVKATSAGVTVNDARFATALYNTIVAGAVNNIAESFEAEDPWEDSGFADSHYFVYVDADKDGKSDVCLDFTLDNADLASANKATKFKATIFDDNSVKYPSVIVAPTADQAKLAAKGLGWKAKTTTTDEVLAKYFTTVNFNFYAIVEFVAGEFAEKTADLSRDNKDVVVDDSNSDGYAVDKITAIVPYRSTLGSVFNSKAVPTAVLDGKVMLNWMDAYTSSVVNANTVIAKDYKDSSNLIPQWHEHTYAPITEKDEKYVKCVWTKDEEGNRSAVLHLHCDDPDCPDYEGSEIIVDGSDSTIGTLSYQDRVEIPATCEKAAGYKYSVEITVASTGKTYKFEDPEIDEEGEPLGHKFDLTKDPTIVWTDANEDKIITADEIKITRVCTVDSTHVVELKVVKVERNEEKSVAPTCTKSGYDIKSITYMDIDEKGAEKEEVTVDYDEKFIVPATGHEVDLENAIIENFNAETHTATLTLKCKNENCDAEEHIVFGPQEVTFTENEDGSFSYVATLIDETTVTVTYEDSIFVVAGDAEWAWTKSADEKTFAKAVAKFTATDGREKIVEVPVSAMTVTTEEGVTTYEATASFVSKGETISATAVKYLDAEGNEVDKPVPFELASAEWTWNKSEDGKSYASATVVFTSKDGKTKELTVSASEIDTTADKYMTITTYGEGAEAYTGYQAYASFTSFGTTVEDLSKEVYLDANGDPYIPDIAYAPVVKWTTKWPENWKKSDPIPTMTYDVTFKWAKAGTEETISGVATVESDPATIDASTKKVQFMAVADLRDFSADAEGKTAAEAEVFYSPVYLFTSGSEESEEVIIINDDSQIAIAGLEDKYYYTGANIVPAITVYDTANEAVALAKGTDYTVKIKDNKNVGTATITVTGKGNYSGKAIATTFQIVNPLDDLSTEEIAELKEIKSVKVLDPKKYDYTGEPIYPKSIAVKFVGDSGFTTYTLDDESGEIRYVAGDAEIPAVVTFSNNINQGTAKVAVTGKTTSKAASYKINKVALVAGKDGEGLEAAYADETIEWQVKGAAPKLTVTWNGRELIEKQDYTAKVTYADNKKKFGAATVKITGKGNFKGKVDSAASFEVVALDLAGENVTFAGTNAVGGMKAKKVTANILDAAGNTINKKSYKLEVLDSDGNAVDTLTAKETYTIKISSAVAMIGAENVLEKEVTVGANFAKAKGKAANGYCRYYTGEPIVFESEEELEAFAKNVVVKIGKDTVLELGKDFEITGYSNNVKKGTMKVTLSGIGDYSGSTTVKIKIAPKPIFAKAE